MMIDDHDHDADGGDVEKKGGLGLDGLEWMGWDVCMYSVCMYVQSLSMKLWKTSQ